MWRLSFFVFACAFIGCSNSEAPTHWTVVDIEMGEIGEYLPDGLPPGTPLGYTIDYAKCQRGSETIYLEAYNGYVPAGMQVGDNFQFNKPLDNIPTIDRLAEHGRYYRASNDDVTNLPGSSQENVEP